MRLGISGLAELRARLAAVRADEVMARALAEQAERVAAVVREGLSGPPGSGEHDRPWMESGALRESVGAVAERLEAAVGSSDPAAAPQEMGDGQDDASAIPGAGGGRDGRGGCAEDWWGGGGGIAGRWKLIAGVCRRVGGVKRSSGSLRLFLRLRPKVMGLRIFGSTGARAQPICF